MRYPTCPPCHGNCRQSRTCPAPRTARQGRIATALDRAFAVAQCLAAIVLAALLIGIVAGLAGCGGGGDDAAQVAGKTIPGPPDCRARPELCA